MLLLKHQRSSEGHKRFCKGGWVQGLVCVSADMYEGHLSMACRSQPAVCAAVTAGLKADSHQGNTVTPSPLRSLELV